MIKKWAVDFANEEHPEVEKVEQPPQEVFFPIPKNPKTTKEKIIQKNLYQFNKTNCYSSTVASIKKKLNIKQ